MSLGKILGIDFGTKRVGLSVSDENRSISFPKSILDNTPDLLSQIGLFIKNENIKEIVIGESLDFYGNPNKIYKFIDDFVLELENKFHLPVYKQKEFLTSVEARRLKDGVEDKRKTESHSRVKKQKTKKVDALSAALILQRYLDKINKK